jgi:HlyD family secretion protein
MLASRARSVTVLAAAVLGLAAQAATSSADDLAPIPGMARETEIRIAPEISGRLESVAVSQGQHVKAGDLLAVIDNPDLTAAVNEATAAATSAAADRANTYSGVRPERVAIASDAVRTAEANLLLAQQQNDRAVTLSSKSDLSKQQLDESVASLAKAKADLDGKRADFEAAKAGPTAQERRLADAKVALAKAAIVSLQARLAKTRLVAPVDGTVGVRVAEPGEIMSPGKPVMTLERDGRGWFAFTIREDMLRGLTIGGAVTLVTADGRRVAARVSELRPLGEFATWRAARAVGDHDLNSFRVRLDPTGDVGRLEPGMMVWLTPGEHGRD